MNVGARRHGLGQIGPDEPASRRQVPAKTRGGAIDGFLTIDQEAFASLPDAAIVELHRNGLMYMLHSHHLSLSNMRRLLERRVAEGTPPAAAPAAANETVPT